MKCLVSAILESTYFQTVSAKPFWTELSDILQNPESCVHLIQPATLSRHNLLKASLKSWWKIQKEQIRAECQTEGWVAGGEDISLWCPVHGICQTTKLLQTGSIIPLDQVCTWGRRRSRRPSSSIDQDCPTPSNQEQFWKYTHGVVIGSLYYHCPPRTKVLTYHWEGKACYNVTMLHTSRITADSNQWYDCFRNACMLHCYNVHLYVILQ